MENLHFKKAYPNIGEGLKRSKLIAYQPSFKKRMVAVLMIVLTIYSSCVKPAMLQADIGPRQLAVVHAATSSTAGSDFTIAVMPDTQFYVTTTVNTAPNHWLDFFTSQTNWIVNNKTSQNIVYAIHLGDISQDGDLYVSPWLRIDTAMSILDNAGMPYGVAVGNHDQDPWGYLSGTTTSYNQYFGVAKFTGKPWYGGHYGSNNDSHYDLFSAGGLDFIVIYLEYDAEHLEDTLNSNNWAYNLLVSNSSRKAIIVTHYLANPDTDPAIQFSAQGLAIYNRIKGLPNVFMMLGGHVNGESYRQDTYNGKTIRSLVSDYQFRPEGGGGYMRIMKFSPANDLVSIQTYSPFHNLYETDSDSQFSFPLFHDERTSRTCDFNQDGKSELAFFSAGIWKVAGMANVTYGTTGDIPIPADYNGDGRAELAVYRPSTKQFFIRPNSPVAYGNSGDVPVPADYNGDGKADIAVWRPSNGTWYVNGGSTTVYGQSGDIPIPGDYNGSGAVQLAVYRPSTRQFFIRPNSPVSYGNTGDIPVPGDYNGDGKVEIAVYRPSNGHWYNYSTGTDIAFGGLAGDIPAPGDYDGDGKTDIAYYRAGTLYVMGGINVTLGSGSDKIVNLPYPVRNAFFP